MPGPPPKRDDERRRVNKPDIETTKVDISELAQLEVEIPKGDENWHPVARLWYDGLTRSGMAQFYEPSDWATAYILAESMSRDLKPQPIVVGQGEDATIEWVVIPLKGSSLSAYLKGFSALMVTEGDRRRVRIELTRREGAGKPVAPVLTIAKRREAALGGS